MLKKLFKKLLKLKSRQDKRSKISFDPTGNSKGKARK